MNAEQLSIIPVLMIIVSSSLILISRRWRVIIIALAVQYFGMFWLVTLVLPLGQAAVKLVVGWMSGAVLAASQMSLSAVEKDDLELSGRVFRLLAAVLIWILAFVTAPDLALWLPDRGSMLVGALLLVGMGLLQLGMTTSPFGVVIGLLTVVSGFEILYAPLERAVLVSGLLAVVNLGLALAGAYLITNMQPAEGDA